MSGHNNSPSTPPARRTLPWQQRRPVSSTFRNSASSPSGVAPSPPPAPSPRTPEPSSPLASTVRNHRLSVSSLSQNFAAPVPPAVPSIPVVRHGRSNSSVKAIAGTFAPQFIRVTDERERRNSTSGFGKGIAGESSDFSGRRWVWVRDSEKAFVKGEVLQDEDGMLTVRCEDGSVGQSDSYSKIISDHPQIGSRLPRRQCR
jgi:myosin protein heavy chain